MKKSDELDDSMRVLSTGTCDTLTGSSRLTYHIGSMPDGEIYLRVHSNTGGGFFSQEWIALADILRALEKRPEGRPITSILLNPLLRGKSANTPGFLLAILLHEKLVRSQQGKLRRHELADPSVFTDKVQKLSVLNSDSNRTVCHIILFLLRTGARLNEALQAKWEHIDVERRVWRIPSTNSKSGKVRAVPLNDSAIGVLEQLDTDTKGRFEHVFINKKTGKPYTTIQKVWNRLRKAADLKDFRAHDIRHSYASMLVNSGRTLYEVQQILGHSNPKMTQRYSHLSTATLQEAASSAADLINEAMKKSA